MNVYLIHAEGTDRYKIGITARTIEYRMKELNSSQAAFPLTLVTSIRSDNYKGIERHLHDRYSNNRKHGEWFSFSQNELVEVQQYMLTFDIPLNQFKPIIKNKSLPRESNQLPLQSLPSLPFKGWILPLLITVGLIWICRNVEFFQSRTNHTNYTKHSISKKK